MNENVQYTLSLRDLLTGKLKEADSAASHLEKTVSGVQNILGALGVGVGIAGVVAFGKKMIEAGTTVENAQTGLTTLLKNADEAKTVINNTMIDAQKTPFAFEGLLSANKALISAGENSVSARENVLNLANAIAATGGGDDELQRMVVNMQQIRNTGKATALDIKQFAYAGINIYQLLADATGKPIEKIKGMEVSYDLLTMALKKAHDEGGMYANGLENMANNTSVQISNLGDAVFQLSVEMFQDLKPAITGVISGLASMVQHLKSGWEWLRDSKDGIVALGVGVVSFAALATGAFVIYNSQLIINSGYLIALRVNTFYAALSTDGLAAALYAAGVSGAVAWGLITGGISLVIAGFYYAWQKSETFRNGIKLLADDAMIAGNAIKLMWYATTGNAKEYENTLARINDLQKERLELINGTYSEHKGEEVTAGSPFVLMYNGQKTAKTGKAGAAKGEEVGSVAPKGASGTKAVTVNISIGKLVETLKISTTNLTESTGKIQEAVANVLLQAVNDASITANI